MGDGNGGGGASGATARSGAQLRSVRRALAALRAFEPPPHSLGVSEISRALGLSKGTVHLLTKVLEGEGFLERDAATGKFQLGPAIHILTAAARRDLRLAAREPMHRLYTETSFPAYLAVLLADRAVIVEKAAPTLSFLAILDVGAPMPLHSSAAGKVLLACSPAETRARLLGALKRSGLEPMTPGTITSFDALRAEIEKVARDGFALDREESLPGVFCVAAPVRGADGEMTAAVSVAAPAPAFEDAGQIELVRDMVRRTAEAISYRLGYRATG